MHTIFSFSVPLMLLRAQFSFFSIRLTMSNFNFTSCANTRIFFWGPLIKADPIFKIVKLSIVIGRVALLRPTQNMMDRSGTLYLKNKKVFNDFSNEPINVGLNCITVIVAIFKTFFRTKLFWQQKEETDTEMHSFWKFENHQCLSYRYCHHAFSEH